MHHLHLGSQQHVGQQAHEVAIVRHDWDGNLA